MENENFTDLAEDIISWSYTAGILEIRSYAQTLERRQPGTISLFSNELINSAISRIALNLRERFDTNITFFLFQAEILTLLRQITLYNTESVFKQYKKKCDFFVNIIPSGNSEWAEGQLKLWKNIFFFITAPSFVESIPFVKSITKTMDDGGKLFSLAQETNLLVGKVSDFLVKNNYVNSVLDEALQQDFQSLLKKLPFLPQEVIAKYSKYDARSAFLLLEQLRNALEYSASVTIPNEEPLDETANSLLFWDYLRQRAEVKYLLDEGARFYTRRIEDSPELSLYENFITLLTPKNISNGFALSQLNKHFQSLSLETQKQDLEILERAITSSIALETLLDPYSADYFLEHIRENPLKAYRIQFINSLQSSIEPERWPLAQATFQLIATFF